MHKVKYIFFLFCACCLAACKKDNVNKSYSYLYVRFAGEEEDISMETVQGNWDFNKHLATLKATGYRFEIFDLILPQVVDTGNYPDISIRNISLSDGLDFLPNRLNSGFIRITYLDTLFIKGEFRVSLGDDFNGAENKIILGEFGIYR